MRKLKTYLLILFFLVLVLFTTKNYASSEDYLVFKKASGEYIVYIENNLEEDYEFAYSESSSANEDELNFINNAKDQENGYSIAYISQNNYEKYFEEDEKAYVFIKVDDTIISTLELDLSQDVVLEEDVEFVKNTTKRITTKTEKVLAETKHQDGIVFTTTVGKLTITDEEASYFYKLVKLADEEEYTKFFDLAEKINSGANVDVIENLKSVREFLNLYNDLLPQEWEEVEKMTISQPEDSEDGDKYIVWLRKENKQEEIPEEYPEDMPRMAYSVRRDADIVQDNNIVEDVQFLIATKEMEEKFVKDVHHEQQMVAQPAPEINLFDGAIKLPVTYDSIALFVILGVLVVILVALIILKRKSKKEKNEN